MTCLPTNQSSKTERRFNTVRRTVGRCEIATCFLIGCVVCQSASAECGIACGGHRGARRGSTALVSTRFRPHSRKHWTKEWGVIVFECGWSLISWTAVSFEFHLARFRRHPLGSSEATCPWPPRLVFVVFCLCVSSPRKVESLFHFDGRRHVMDFTQRLRSSPTSLCNFCIAWIPMSNRNVIESCVAITSRANATCKTENPEYRHLCCPHRCHRDDNYVYLFV